jgi:hypothetical protein
MPYLIVSFFLQVFVIHGTPFNFISIVMHTQNSAILFFFILFLITLLRVR